MMFKAIFCGEANPDNPGKKANYGCDDSHY